MWRGDWSADGGSAELILGQVSIRRRQAGRGGRRPRFLARRKTGRLPARPQIFRGENEIIART
ncbi:hypothetical protein CCS92_35815 [Methylobacterium radiotolerans]|nr:hypothetical protein CCS92_35815 [Methylobacterium radiotolerans]